VLKVPVELADELPAEVERILKREAELILFCQSPEFSFSKLETILNQESASCQPRYR